MNERIKELAETALDDLIVEVHSRANPALDIKVVEKTIKTTINGFFLDEFKEKFAKLIVAECIEVFGKDLPKIDDKNFNILDLTNRICNVAEHFEIKD